MKTHVAIMKKSWGMIPKILTGEKTIESRWYFSQSQPWGGISSGDVIYFKNSGEPVTLSCKVKAVEQFEKLTPFKVGEIIKRYAREMGIEDVKEFYDSVKNKKYCILVFIDNPRRVKPFQINKVGFGIMSAWITVEDINRIKC